MLTVVSFYSRESLDIHVDQSIKGVVVVRVLNNIVAIRVKPMAIKTDNGCEFTSKNAVVESLNGRLLQECLNEHWFMSLQDARHKLRLGGAFITRKDLTVR